MVQSVCNFKSNALEMCRTPIANVIVKLNLKGRIAKGWGWGVYIYLFIYTDTHTHKRKKMKGKVRK
jgi:hypothetical protein